MVTCWRRLRVLQVPLSFELPVLDQTKDVPASLATGPVRLEPQLHWPQDGVRLEPHWPEDGSEAGASLATGRRLETGTVQRQQSAEEREKATDL